MGDRKAITEEDVQHWKRRRIRSAKSAESLLSLPITSRLGSPLTESLDPNKLMNMLSGNHNILSQFMGKETFGWYDSNPCNMSHVMRKPVLPYANNKGSDQPAQCDQHLCCSLPRYLLNPQFQDSSLSL